MVIAAAFDGGNDLDEMFPLLGVSDAAVLKIQPTFDWRVRLERRLDRDFAQSADDDRTDALNRIRPGVSWSYGPEWSGEVQYQLAHNEIWRPGRTSSDEASDLNLAYARYKTKDVDLTIGRQKINIGSERLIGSLEWSMTGRAFDGVRVKAGNWDAYAFKVGVAHPKPGRMRIAGAAYQGGHGLSSLIFKHDDQASPATDVWTLSHHWQKQLGRWNLDAEGAVQSGRVAGRNLRAWALHLGATHSFDARTKGFVEINAASGGGNPGATYTVDNLLPTNHKFYGSMDLQSWRNMEELAFGVDHQVDRRTLLRAHFHSFSLRDPSDAWYGAGGGANVGAGGPLVDATGSSGRDVGRELDLEFSYRVDTRLTLTGGIAAFWPGNFVKARNAGNASTQYWGFLAAQYRF